MLVVRGSLDPICNEAWAEEVARLAPRGRLVLIPGVAHTLCYTAPMDLAGVCRPFIDEGWTTRDAAWTARRELR